MSSKLILYNGPTSPFGRKAKIISLIHEIKLEEKIINIYEADFLDIHNPSRKIPTLIGDNFTIIDSDNICLYFDSISDKQTIFPQNEYWQIMTYTSIANDLMETVLNRFIETLRKDNEKSKDYIKKLEIRIIRIIEWFEKNINFFHNKKLTMDKIAIACALEYTMFRFTNNWQKNNNNLSLWLENFKENNFMKLTKPKI
tara:strand:- start:245 stop:841 length:597 start_codon:yes stop_codon:yes gene_type:complete